jgi:hypothetical protein
MAETIVAPERDTPGVLSRYVSSDAFPKGLIGLGGTPAQVHRGGIIVQIARHPERSVRCRMYAWALLLARIDEVFPLVCPHCDGAMPIIEGVETKPQCQAFCAKGLFLQQGYYWGYPASGLNAFVPV